MKERWSVEAIQAWYAEQPWLVGCNYVPSNAVNAVEMWRKETFSPELIRKELTMGAGIGMNSVRVFLSHTVWQAEGPVFLNTLEQFLQIADSCGMKVLPILFDDCAFDSGADPYYGPQPEPVFGVHNSRWVPSPGFRVQDDPALMASCKDYLDAVIGAHREDSRIVAWDLYNEPGNTDRPLDCLPLLYYSFKWARANDPAQPLTAGLFAYTYPAYEISNQLMLELCDVINFHSYSDQTRQWLEKFSAYGRPVFLTEWLHRPNGNTIPDLLPVFHEKKVGIWNWGLVVGKTQTNLAWQTNWLGGVPDANPKIWQHDLFRQDGTPYDPEEAELFRKLTGTV